jgi:hypothetical protein
MAPGQRRKRSVTVEQKYELWTALVRGDATQRQLADRWGVDRTTVAEVAQVAKHGALSALETSKPGRPGTVDPHDQELRDTRGDRPADRGGQGAGHRADPVAGRQRGAW